MNSQKGKNIAVLSSSVTLGVYVPALTFFHQLKQCSEYKDSCFYVYEDLLSLEKRNGLNTLKKKYHENFKFVLMAQKLSVHNNNRSIENHELKALYKHWYSNKISYFIVFSGFWIPAINKYSIDYSIQVFGDFIMLDASLSNSWKSQQATFPYTVKRLFDLEAGKLNYSLLIGRNIIPPHKRDGILVHGGGWGVGNYQEILEELQHISTQILCLAYFKKDIQEKNNIIFITQDEKWLAGSNFNGIKLSFPDLIPTKEHELVIKDIQCDGHELEYSKLYEYITRVHAIISKPGGGTLVDSYSANTPIVFLKSCGKHEEANAIFWKKMGFGIDYQEWKSTNYSLNLLGNLKENIRKYKAENKIENLIQYYNETRT